ncbi:hypothetical protein GCM10009710_03290 [Aeromicrobium alkaliterrae]|uniref:Uncharacterized protein n=1 Tax=Aeromicrobium alkaliterrae TaxID=302168 RepID=A0ABN2JG90_9ACTN
MDTYFGDRKSKLRVKLTEEQHETAIRWYRDRATVIVAGSAEQVKTGLSMQEPTRLEAWSNTTLRFDESPE